MYEFNVSEDMKKKWYDKEGGSRESSGTFMSNTICQRTEC